MNRFTTIAVAAVAGLASLTACSNGPTDAPVADAPGAPLLAAGGNSGPSAHGAGHFDIGGELRTFSFTAVTHRDGTVNGQAQLVNRAADTRTHVEINCLRVAGKTAFVSGVVSNASNPALEGQPAIFSVQDNGEGSDATPDLVSLVFIGGSTPLVNACQAPLQPTPTNVVERGNIQVQP
jgi:hypothetical protein